MSVRVAALAVLGTAANAQNRNYVVILLDEVGTDFLAQYAAQAPYQHDLPYDPVELGEGDLPDNGPGTSNLFVHAPNLEALAASGVQFMDAYAHPRCSPTRASLLTGCHPLRTGVGDILRWDNDEQLLGALRELGDAGFDLQTLPQLVQQASYADFVVGKWHMGMATAGMGHAAATPCNLGWSTIPRRGHFTEWACVFNGVDSMPKPAANPETGAPPASYYNFFFNRGSVDAQGEETHQIEQVQDQYATRLQFEEAAAWCNDQSTPFFCFISLNAAHSPWAELPPDEMVATDEYETTDLDAFTRYMAKLEAIDAGLGEFLDALLDGVEAQTTFFLLGDNGTPEIVLEHARGSFGSEKDLGGTYDFLLGTGSTDDGRFKGEVYEKGVRVPFIVSGAGVVNPGRTSRALVQVEDIFPTIAESMGLDPGPVDGISFDAILRDEISDAEHARTWIWSERFSPTGPVKRDSPMDMRRIGCSVRIPGSGRFKIVRMDPAGPDEFYQLEDASWDPVDPWETVELAIPVGPGSALHAEYQAVLARIDTISALGDLVADEVETLPYCDAAPHSAGSPVKLYSGGSVSLVEGSFRLFIEDGLVGQPGILFHGGERVEPTLPFGNGFLCATEGVVRIDPIYVPVGNPFCYDPVFDGDIEPHETRYFQFWYRDPWQPGGAGFNLSNGLEVTFLP